MRSLTRSFPRLAALACAAAVFAAFSAPSAEAAQPAVSVASVENIALSGYDPVAYFTAGAPMEGKRAHTAQYAGATWRFASEANRLAFLAAPAKYAPQFGGYCAWAVSQGYTAPADPTAWKIVGGKLYVNYSHAVAATWSKDIPGNIVKANANWPAVLQK